MNIVDIIEKENLQHKPELILADKVKKYFQQKNRKADIEVGDLVKVHYKVVEAGKERLQPFKGTIIAIKNGSIRKTFTVRRKVGVYGVERTFIYHSPNLAKIEILKKHKVARAKLYYLRDKIGKDAKLKELVVAKKKS